MKGISITFLLIGVIAIVMGITSDIKNAGLIGWGGGVLFLLLATITAIKRRSVK